MAEFTDTPRSTGCCDWKKTVDDLSSSTEKFVREDPAKAIGLAMLGGVLLTVLPVGRLISALVRLAFALARPLFLVLGAVKLYEEFQKNQKP
jgi:Na+(H+)/acetate symporter ActP